jgi:predicted transcriptional regulator
MIPSPLKVLTMDRKQVSFRIEPDIIKRLKFIALEQDRSLTDLFLEAIKEILKKYENKANK